MYNVNKIFKFNFIRTLSPLATIRALDGLQEQKHTSQVFTSAELVSGQRPNEFSHS